MKTIMKVLCTVFICMLFGVCSFAASYEQATKVAYDPPITAVLPDGTHLDIVKNRSNYLCLPGNVEFSDVAFVYIGSEKLYLPEEDRFVAFGESFSLDADPGEYTFYEYIGTKDEYYSYSVNIMQGSKVSSLYIEFDDSYSYDVLQYLGRSKEHSATGSLYMTDKDGEVLYDGTLDSVKCRGNSSFFSPGMQGDKRSYNLKLTEKAELIDGAGEMKKWSLLHMRIDTVYDYDLTGLTSVFGLRTYEALCDEGYYTNKLECVDVYIEGQYRGAYFLVERLDVNAAVDITDSEKFLTGEQADYEFVDDSDDPAIKKGIKNYLYSSDVTATEDLDITGGYLLEACGYSDRCCFTTARGITFEIKAPEICTKEQVQYIASYIQDFEDALYSKTGRNGEGKHYSEYMDVKSLADGVLTYAFYQNWELMRTSTYIYKDVEGSDHEKFTFGPVWDFETGAHTMKEDQTLFGEHNFYDEYRQYAWIEQLWTRADFMEVASQSAHKLSDYMHGMLDGEDAPVYDMLASQLDSMTMNWARWDLQKAIKLTRKFPELDNTYSSQAEFHIDAMRARLENWDKYWSGEYLTGAQIESGYDADSGEYTLTLLPMGEAEECQWFRLDENGDTELIEGADGLSCTVSEPGVYYCTFSGKNNAFNKRADGNIFSERLITMSLAYDLSEAIGAQQDGGLSPWIYVVIVVGVLLVIVAATILFMPRRKK